MSLRNVMPELLSWWRRGEPVALATVVQTWRSAPTGPGTCMLIGPDGSTVGSVSGGCVESDVHALAEQVRDDGQPALRHYGVSDDDAHAVGLTCGGGISLFIQPINTTTFTGLDVLASNLLNDQPVAIATIIDGPDPASIGRRLTLVRDEQRGTLGDPWLDAVAGADLHRVMTTDESRVASYRRKYQHDPQHVFLESLVPRPRMLIFGMSDFAVALSRQGAAIGYHVTVCDARPTFATPTRFPHADELVIDWPHRYLQSQLDAGLVDARAAICVLTHDPKFDLPLLQVALTAQVGCYVGAIGSRRADMHRRSQLVAAGLSSRDLGRLHSPIGLDLGARTPEETALSIAAEIVADRYGRPQPRLSDRSGTVHLDRRKPRSSTVDDLPSAYETRVSS